MKSQFNQANRTDLLMQDILLELRTVFGEALRQVLVFGSYARGDQDEYSDLDVMVLVNLTDEEIKKSRRRLDEISEAVMTRQGVMPSIIVRNYQHFYRWLPNLPFYREVKERGIELYAG